MLDFSDLEPEGGSCIDQGTGKADKEFWCQSQTFLRTSGEVAPHSTSMPSSSGLAFSTPVTAMTNKMRYERGAPLLRKEGDLNQQQEHQQQEGHVDRLGRLQVQSLYARHRAHLPLVLRGVSFEMTAGEHVGVVGRTGSGKSSLAQALVRLIEPFSLPPGRAPVVLLDGIDTNALSLHALRRAIAVVPQVGCLKKKSTSFLCFLGGCIEYVFLLLLISSHHYFISGVISRNRLFSHTRMPFCFAAQCAATLIPLTSTPTRTCGVPSNRQSWLTLLNTFLHHHLRLLISRSHLELSQATVRVVMRVPAAVGVVGTAAVVLVVVGWTLKYREGVPTFLPVSASFFALQEQCCALSETPTTMAVAAVNFECYCWMRPPQQSTAPLTRAFSACCGGSSKR